MNIISSLPEIRNYCDHVRGEKKTIGLVPTMGYLHEGHLSLIENAKRSCDIVITSIFVNPAQFSPSEDFASYPRDIEQDTRLSESAGCSALFVPDASAMYPEGYSTFVSVDRISSVLEGKFRPTHFRGVATIVAKLFLLTRPHKAFFGQKDAQQCIVLKKMVTDLNIDVEIVVVPIVREASGLAKSSRNVYLSPKEKEDASILNGSLRRAEEMVAHGERDVAKVVGEMKRMIGSRSSTTIDYVSVVEAESLEDVTMFEPGVAALVALAVRVGTTRLIDNTIIIPR